MPGYDALHYHPPAPIAQVILRAASGATVNDTLRIIPNMMLGKRQRHPV